MTSAAMMRSTLLALMPGLAACTWIFGIGIVCNVAIGAIAAILTEIIMLKLRSRNLRAILDGTALLTGTLLGLCLPPLLPIWMVIAGVVFALVFGKHLYGGTGHNLFNPAMVGFAMLIISFPLAMSSWPDTEKLPEVASTLAVKLGLAAASAPVDAVSAATPLDAYKFRSATTNQEFFTGEQEINLGHWALVNLAFLVGGAYLLARRIIPWQLPASFLLTLCTLSLIFYDGGSSASLGSPVFHLLAGATMLSAFFIITDPVTSPGYRQGLVIFGVGVGLITFILRCWGAYPEGVAFAVLLMNATSPLIDHYFAAQEQIA